MAKSLSQLMQDADEIIQRKTASGLSTTNLPHPTDDDIFGLAASLRYPTEATKVASSEDDALVFSVMEKIAEAQAISDTLCNLPTLLKIDHLEKTARAQGYTDAQIAEHIQKNAQHYPLRNSMQG